jgi:hypothetical protein
MTTARAIILSSVILALAILAATGLWVSQYGRADRFDLANTGSGTTMRLDRATGDMIRCDQGFCSAVVKGGKIIRDGREQDWPSTPAEPSRADDTIPSPPPGFKLVPPPPPPGFTLDDASKQQK